MVKPRSSSLEHKKKRLPKQKIVNNAIFDYCMEFLNGHEKKPESITEMILALERMKLILFDLETIELSK